MEKIFFHYVQLKILNSYLMILKFIFYNNGNFNRFDCPYYNKQEQVTLFFLHDSFGTW